MRASIRSIEKFTVAISLGIVLAGSASAAGRIGSTGYSPDSDRPAVNNVTSPKTYSFRGFESRKAYEREMMVRCGSVMDVGVSPVFGAPLDYQNAYPNMGKLSAEIMATVYISDAGRNAVNAMHQQTKEKIDQALKHIEYSRNAEEMARKQIHYNGEVVPENSRRGNRTYRHEETKIVNHQRQEGVTQAISILGKRGDLPYLEQCQEWWVYQQESSGFTNSQWFR